MTKLFQSIPLEIYQFIVHFNSIIDKLLTQLQSLHQLNSVYYCIKSASSFPWFQLKVSSNENDTAGLSLIEIRLKNKQEASKVFENSVKFERFNGKAE
jgi:hypothetical protein